MTVYTGSCGPNATWAYDDESTVLTISGTGAMDDYSTAKSVPWYSYTPSATKIVIGEGITHIGNNAFYANNRDPVCTTLQIASTVTSIGAYAFFYLTNVTTPIVLKKIVTIADCAFMGCQNIPEIYLGSRLTSVGIDSFRVCMRVKKITFLGPQPTLAGMAFSLGFASTPDSPHNVTAVVYSKGWASDSVFTNEIRGGFTTFTYVVKVPATANVNVNGTPKTYRICVNVGGTWYSVDTAYGKLNGTWTDVGQ